jgi:UDP-N-acetyl-2-amino-2-deoxyglucuronate dehydrogenase
VNDPIRVAVCGIGNAGIEHLRAFTGLSEADVTAIVDRDTERGRTVAADLGLPYPVFPSLAEALHAAPVDAVVVATPNDLHADMTVEAARAGKHVLLEKPAAITDVDLQRMTDEVAAAGVQCQVNMILRWHPMIQAIVGEREAGRLGEVFCVEADFVFGELEGSEPDWARTVAQGGSLHLYAGCHAYDQLEWIAGSRIEEIGAVSTRRSQRWEYDVTACAVVRFANGAIGRATITLEAAAPYRFGIRVLGTNATVVDNTICVPRNGEGQFMELCSKRVDVTYLPFERVASDFVSNVRSDTESHASLARTADLFRLALDADKSARERRIVDRGPGRLA